MRYALLIYDDIEVRDRTPDEQRRRITAAVLEVLDRPNVTGWLRLQDVESATTVRREQGRALLTDGPFVDSKDFLGGFVVVEAENLDGALDRSLWDHHRIDEGRGLLERALTLRGSGPYVIQGAIADLHLREPRDWAEIVLLYERLEQITRSPVVAMNRAIAIAALEGPEAGLALLDGLELDEYRYYHSTRADLLRRLGRDDEARADYARALELTEPGPEHRFLERRLAGLCESADVRLGPSCSS